MLAVPLIAAVFCVLVGSATTIDATMTVGVVLPTSKFRARFKSCQKQLSDSWTQIGRSPPPLGSHWPQIKFETVYWPVVPSPNEILRTLCDVFLPKRVTLIIYVTDSQLYADDVRASEYFLKFTDSIGVPVIAWNAVTSGLSKSPSSTVLQLAPTESHQAQAMLAILLRYEWRQFCCVTSGIEGSDDFLQALKERIVKLNHKLELLSVLRLNVGNDDDVSQQLSWFMSREPTCRIFLLHSTVWEAKVIFRAANRLGFTNKEFLWLATQSVVTEDMFSPEFPIGLLGVHYNTGKTGRDNACSDAIRVFGRGLQMHMTPVDQLRSNLACSRLDNVTWSQGVQLFQSLKSVRVMSENDDDVIEFDADGTLKQTTLKIMNLDIRRQWQTVGLWNKNRLTINDIVWPAGSHVPPLGKPEKFHLKVAFLEEPPYLNMERMDNDTEQCSVSAVRCFVPPSTRADGLSYDPVMCCSGLCVDLLRKLSTDLDFSYELTRVADGSWGSLNNGKWNGLMAELVEHRVDMVMTSLKINSERAAAVDFSLPYLETGIAVIVAKRTGIISPNAFLQPFDGITWFAITVVAIQAGALAIFFFEWLSPAGYDRKNTVTGRSELTLFQTYWMAWAFLFGAAVNLADPKGCTARFMANCWAAFAMIFIAIYTASLANFMITREQYYDLKGLDDPMLSHPISHFPPFRFGTIPYGNTETVIKTNFHEMYMYMRQFNRSTVIQGVKAVKSGELDAFVYDATVLEHLAAKDDDCRLLTVGDWYSMTGYGVAFIKGSKYRDMFSRQILAYRQSGELEKWQKFWLGGACKPKTDASSEGQLDGFGYQKLTFEQFISAFVLLAAGVVVAFVVLLLEHCYFRCGIRKALLKRQLKHRLTASVWWPLISQNVSSSLAVTSSAKDTDRKSRRRWTEPGYELALWRAKRELDLSLMREQHLKDTLQTIQDQFIQGTLL